MAKLNLEENLKIGKQELLLGQRTVNKCGSEVDGLLANDLDVLLDNGTTVPLITWITNRCSGNCQNATPTTQELIVATFGGIS